MKRTKMIVKVLFVVLALLLAAPVHCVAVNPIVQTLYTADPAPMVYDGVCYVYTSHDEDGTTTYFNMNDWRCYSSTDMQNWTDLGCPLSYTDFEWAEGEAWAGQCVERNGKFYFYVPIAPKWGGGHAIGVAVADSPEGPFVDAIGKPLIPEGWRNIDPTVFIDDDGQAYMYFGNPYLRYVKLNEDMISYSGEIEEVALTPEGFGKRPDAVTKMTLYEEGPWLYKRNELYYMAYAASGIPENICYATSDSPIGPWTFGGVIMPTQGGSFTNHPGVIEYKGNSYFFYHNDALPGGSGFTRSVCVEQFSYNEDGSFPTINMTSEGPEQIGSLDPYRRVEAETICYAEGIETESCSTGGMNIYNIAAGSTIMVKGVDFGSGASSFEAAIASGANGGSIDLRLDMQGGDSIGTCTFSGTGGWQEWETVSCEINGAEGIHDLYMVFSGTDEELFNVDWWSFTKIDTGTAESDLPNEPPEPDSESNTQEPPNDEQNDTVDGGFNWAIILVPAGIVLALIVALVLYRRIKTNK